MDLRDLYEKVIEANVCTGIKITGEVIDFYPSFFTDSGEDEIDIFPNETNQNKKNFIKIYFVNKHGNPCFYYGNSCLKRGWRKK